VGVAALNQVRADKHGVIQVILSAIELHESAASVAEEGFKALCNICENAENQSLAGKLGAIQAILSSIKRHLTSPEVAAAGACALRNVCRNAENQGLAQQHRAIAWILNCIVLHQTNADVAEQAFAALVTICAKDRYTESLWEESGTIEHCENCGGWRSVYKYKVKRDTNKTACKGCIPKAGAMELILFGIYCHTSIASVAEQGSAALVAICANDESAASAGTEGALEILVDVMKLHESCEPVQIRASEAIRSIVRSTGKGNRDRAKRIGAVELLEKALARFSASGEIKRHAKDAILKIRAGG
jgi:hypothetical protein